MTNNLPKKNKSDILIYQSEDGQTRIDVQLLDETVWLTQKLMAELFQLKIPTINEHIKNIYSEGELVSEATIRKFRIVQKEGKRDVERLIDKMVNQIEDKTRKAKKSVDDIDRSPTGIDEKLIGYIDDPGGYCTKIMELL